MFVFTFHALGAALGVCSVWLHLEFAQRQHRLGRREKQCVAGASREEFDLPIGLSSIGFEVHRQFAELAVDWVGSWILGGENLSACDTAKS